MCGPQDLPCARISVPSLYSLPSHSPARYSLVNQEQTDQSPLSNFPSLQLELGWDFLGKNTQFHHPQASKLKPPIAGEKFPFFWGRESLEPKQWPHLAPRHPQTPQAETTGEKRIHGEFFLPPVSLFFPSRLFQRNTWWGSCNNKNSQCQANNFSICGVFFSCPVYVF